MDIELIIKCKLEDSLWGFSDLLDGRKFNDETKEEIIKLVEENLIDAIEENPEIDIKPC